MTKMPTNYISKSVNHTFGGNMTDIAKNIPEKIHIIDHWLEKLQYEMSVMNQTIDAIRESLQTTLETRNAMAKTAEEERIRCQTR
jgi:hypothetical protein